MLIAATALFYERNFLPVAVAALVGGTVGALTDSLLGATLQAQYRSVSGGRLTELRVDSDGQSTVLVRGLPWLKNDAVNLLSTLAGAATAALLVRLLSP